MVWEVIEKYGDNYIIGTTRRNPVFTTISRLLLIPFLLKFLLWDDTQSIYWGVAVALLATLFDPICRGKFNKEEISTKPASKCLCI